jgi:hypothetical protein
VKSKKYLGNGKLKKSNKKTQLKVGDMAQVEHKTWSTILSTKKTLIESKNIQGWKAKLINYLDSNKNKKYE